MHIAACATPKFASVSIGNWIKQPDPDIQTTFKAKSKRKQYEEQQRCTLVTTHTAAAGTLVLCKTKTLPGPKRLQLWQLGAW